MNWLADPRSDPCSGDDQAHSPAFWSSSMVALELGAILKAKEASRENVPRSHCAFSSMHFTPALTQSNVIADDEEPLESMDIEPEMNAARMMSTLQQEEGRWLDTDDIEDF